MRLHAESTTTLDHTLHIITVHKPEWTMTIVPRNTVQHGAYNSKQSPFLDPVLDHAGGTAVYLWHKQVWELVGVWIGPVAWPWNLPVTPHSHQKNNSDVWCILHFVGVIAIHDPCGAERLAQVLQACWFKIVWGTNRLQRLTSLAARTKETPMHQTQQCYFSFVWMGAVMKSICEDMIVL